MNKLIILRYLYDDVAKVGKKGYATKYFLAFFCLQNATLLLE